MTVIPMKNCPRIWPSRSRPGDVTIVELRQFVERYEHLEAEKKDITDQQKRK